MKPLLHNKYLLYVTIFAIALFMAFHLLLNHDKKQEAENTSNGTSVNKQFIKQNN